MEIALDQNRSKYAAGAAIFVFAFLTATFILIARASVNDGEPSTATLEEVTTAEATTEAASELTATDVTATDATAEPAANTAAASTIPGLYPFTSERLLTESDVAGLSKHDLRIMRNEIFARHGYRFKTADMKQHFNSQSWYTPRYDDVTSMLTTIENKNIVFIKRHE